MASTTFVPDINPTCTDSELALLRKLTAGQADSMGASGVYTGNNFSGDASAIQCLTECTFTTFTENNDTGTMTGFAIPAGVVILNATGITAVVASSGTFRAYLR